MGNQETPQYEEQEIDLLEVFVVLWRKAWVLVLSLILGGILAGAVTFFLITPQYEATSIIYILSKTTSITSLADLQIGANLAADFQIIATTREVLEPVMEEYGVYDVYGDYETFVEHIEVTNPTNSHMLQITVEHPDAYKAAQISNAIADQLRLQIAEVMSTDTPSTVERAVVPDGPSSPSMLINCVVGGLICLIVAIGVILVGHFMDDTIKDAEDVTKYLGLEVLATIPLEHSGTSKSAKKTSKKFHRSTRRTPTAADNAGRRVSR